MTTLLLLVAISTMHADPTIIDFPRPSTPAEIAEAVFVADAIVLARAVDTGVVARYRYRYSDELLEQKGMIFEVVQVIKGDVDSARVSLLRHRTDTLQSGATIELVCLEELPSPSYYDTIRIGDLCLLRVGRYSTGWHVVDEIGEGLSRMVAGETDPFVQAMRVLARVGDPAAHLDSLRAIVQAVESGDDRIRYPEILGTIARAFLTQPSRLKSFEENARIFAGSTGRARTAAAEVIARHAGVEAREWMFRHYDSIAPREAVVYFTRLRDAEGIARVLADYRRNFRSPIRAAAVTPLLIRAVDTSHRAQIFDLIRDALGDLESDQADTSLLGRIGRSARIGDVARWAEGFAGTGDLEALRYLRAVDARLPAHSVEVTRALAGLGDEQSILWGVENARNSESGYRALTVMAMAAGPFADSVRAEWLRKASADDAIGFIEAMTPHLGFMAGLGRVFADNVRLVASTRTDNPIRARLLRSIAIAGRAGEPVDRTLLAQLGCR